MMAMGTMPATTSVRRSPRYPAANEPGTVAAMTAWICMALAVIAGLALGVQGPANGALARTWDFWRAVTLNGFVVLLATAVGMVLTRGGAPVPGRAPCSQMIGGLCGAVVICSAAYVVPRLGAAKFNVGLVFGMLVAAALVDHYGWFGQVVQPLTVSKIAGLGLVVAGVAVMRLM